MSQTLVLQAIASLVRDGKTPTMALVKSRLAGPVPMPVIIQTLTSYKSNPAIIEQIPAQAEESAAAQPQADLREEVQQLRQEVQLLRQELASLKAKIG